MEITWLGHACFRIKSTHGIIITDPCNPETGYILGKQTARIVTVSHKHPDHCYTEGISGEYRLVDRPGEYEISDIMIIGISTFHDGQRGERHGKNIVFLIETDDISICHLGDLGHILTASQVEQLEPVDVLLIPVGGQTTINATMAAEIVRQLEPKIVIPMHYRTPVFPAGTIELDPVDRFLTEMGATSVVPQPKLNVTRSSLPETTQICVLDYPKANVSPQ